MMFLRLFSVLLLVFPCLSSQDPLCFDRSSSSKCLCKRLTDDDTTLPSSLADCSGLNLKRFPDASQFPEDVTHLDLSLNQIDALDSSLTRGSTTLKRLVLAYNRISRVEAKFFSEMIDLRQLDLSHNRISSLSEGSVFSGLKHLRHVDLSFNQIKELPSAIFDSLPLKYLDLSYNDLGEFMAGSKDILRRTLGLNVNVTHLKLNRLGLQDIYPDFFTRYESLKHVEIMDNNFNTIPVVPYSVEYLDISGNNLTYLSARHLNYHSLKVLRASRMPSLTSVHHYAFYNLQSLEKLVITDCPNLKEFTELAFGLASKAITIHPKSLILARNGLTSLNSTYKFMFRKMDHVNLLYNPWECDCNILWLQEFDTELFDSREIRCASPSELKSMKILDLKEADLAQCHPQIYGKRSHKMLIIVLMGVIIFLIGFIMFLIRYPKFLADPKHIGVSPQSPYSAAPQEERA